MTNALDPKGLEAARKARDEAWPLDSLEAIIRAYLSTVIPAEIAGVVEEWRKAAEGVTPGPWSTQSIPSRSSAGRYNVVGPSEIVAPHDGICEPDRFNDRSFAEDEANIRWIARCSPDAIASLLTLIERLAASQAETSDPYTRQSAADLVSEIDRDLPPDFPNYADWSITIPAGHWRAIRALIDQPSTEGGTDG